MDAIRQHKLLAGISLLVTIALASIGWTESAGIRGKIAAARDVQKGRLIELGFGLPPPWMPAYIKILRDKYGIEYHAVAGCIVSPGLIAYVNGYDSVSSEAIEKRFKHDVFVEAAGDAERGWTREQTANVTPATIPEYIFPYAEKAKDAACFRSLPRPISMYQVVSKCGRPDEEIGSGIYIFLYHFADGTTVSIGTPYLQQVGDIKISRQPPTLTRKSN